MLNISTLRHENYEYYLYVMIVPPTYRSAVHAIVAFSWELEQIQYKVSEAMLGHIRFAWWRETLDLLQSGECARSHPVIDALKATLPQFPTLLTVLYKRYETEQRAYTLKTEQQQETDSKHALLHDIVDFLRTTDSLMGEKWFRKAQILYQAAEKSPITPNNIRLLFQLLF